MRNLSFPEGVFKESHFELIAQDNPVFVKVVTPLGVSHSSWARQYIILTLSLS